MSLAPTKITVVGLLAGLDRGGVEKILELNGTQTTYTYAIPPAGCTR